jgi:geranylgeranyl diphosphate synthase type II
MDLKQQLQLFEDFLSEKTYANFPLPSLLNTSIHYSLLGGGKRIRPLLCLGFAEAYGGNRDQALRYAMAVEMIHAYSLIHDDLPAMDDDNMRRGKPTNHIVFGEAQAILAGDALLNMAPEFLLRELSFLKVDPNKIIEIVTLLLKASGHQGMANGQSLDIEYESKDLSHFDKSALEDILKNIHKLKTGAIITWSCVAGLYTQNDAVIIQKNLCLVKSIGQRIGLLFQMVDDILDVTSNLQDLGKTPGKDKLNGKLTYTHIYGLEGSIQISRSLIQEIYVDLEDPKNGNNWDIVRAIVHSLEKQLQI